MFIKLKNSCLELLAKSQNKWGAGGVNLKKKVRGKMQKREIKNICIFCGSSLGNSDEFSKAADRLAEAMTSNRVGLVYGGLVFPCFH